MLQFIFRRFLIFIPMLFLMSVVAFAIIQAPPGDFLSDYIALPPGDRESRCPARRRPWIR